MQERSCVTLAADLVVLEMFLASLIVIEALRQGLPIEQALNLR